MHVLVTGGARSGKSSFAESLYPFDGVCYVATYVKDLQDKEMLDRISKHQQTRNPKWQTKEVSLTLDVIHDFVLVDCLSIFTSNVLFAYTKDVAEINDNLFTKMEKHIQTELKKILKSCPHCIFVTNEVGSSLVPQNQIERVYRDLLGRVNCWLAKQVDEVYLVVCAQPLKIK